jgi:hypothetical protein
MAKKTSGLLDAVLAEPPINTGPKSWFDRLDEGDAKSQLRDLHIAWHSGRLDAYSAQHLHRKTKELLGLTVGISGFENWLKRENPDG